MSESEPIHSDCVFRDCVSSEYSFVCIFAQKIGLKAERFQHFLDGDPGTESQPVVSQTLFFNCLFNKS